MPAQDQSFYLFKIIYTINGVAWEGLTTSLWLRNLCTDIEGWEVCALSYEYKSWEELREHKAYYSTQMTDVMHLWCKLGPEVTIEREGESVQAFMQVGCKLKQYLYTVSQCSSDGASAHGPYPSFRS
jgi:hypothetical protein